MMSGRGRADIQDDRASAESGDPGGSASLPAMAWRKRGSLDLRRDDPAAEPDL